MKGNNSLMRILLCVIAAIVLAAPAVAAPATITVANTVYGGTTTATVSRSHQDAYVLVQCYAPGFGDAFVYGAYFVVDENNQALLGPIASILWTGAAECVATEGWFTARGFGEWKVIAETTFLVAS